MKPEQNEQIERTEKFLNERWYIANIDKTGLLLNQSKYNNR